MTMGDVIDLEEKRREFRRGTDRLIEHMKALDEMVGQPDQEWADLVRQTLLSPDEFDRIIKDGIDYCRSKASGKPSFR